MAHAESEEGFLSEAAWAAKNAVEAEACDIFTPGDRENLLLRASTCMPELVNHLKLGIGVGVTGKVFARGDPMFVGRGLTQHPDYVKYPGMDDLPWESAALIPMRTGGEALGICLFRRTGSWRFTPALRAKCLQLGRTLTGCLAGYKSAYNAGAHTNRLGALSEVSKTISTSPYVEEILQLLVNLTAQQFNYKVCTVRLLDERSNELVLRATQAPAKAYQRKRAIKLGESIAGRALAENRPIIVPSVRVFSSVLRRTEYVLPCAEKSTSAVTRSIPESAGQVSLRKLH